MIVVINTIGGDITFLFDDHDHSPGDHVLSKIKTSFGFHFYDDIFINPLFERGLNRPLNDQVRRSVPNFDNIVLGKRGRWYVETLNTNAKLFRPADIIIIGDFDDDKKECILTTIRLNNYDTKAAFNELHSYLPIPGPEQRHIFKIEDLVKELNNDDSVVEWIPLVDNGYPLSTK